MNENAKFDEIVIENASADDVDVAALLTQQAYEEFSYVILGVNNDEKAMECYRKLWRHENNRFSYRYSYVAKSGSKIIGLLTCYSADVTDELYRPTVKQFVRMGGIRYIWHVITRLKEMIEISTSVDAYPDEFYLNTIAVLPELRGKGIGVLLLDHMRAMARAQGVYKCALHVDKGNEAGVRFYERNGFVIDLEAEDGSSYSRMVNSFHE